MKWYGGDEIIIPARRHLLRDENRLNICSIITLVASVPEPLAPLNPPGMVIAGNN
ncbi:MAG TPA: hypothetical protein VJO32_11815 [Ktedonobacteraceae bacterium]|nr:hypothetical protein [Ktedonobacteraceae bacterium]